MKTRCIIVAAVASIVASHASAAAVNVKYVGKGKGSDVKITHGNTTQNVFAGQLKHELTNPDAPYGPSAGVKITFCTDLTQYVSKNTTVYQFVPIAAMPGTSPMGAGKADAIQDMYNGGNGAPIASNASNDYAAAFQLAVWEVVMDFNPNVGIASLNLTDGQFKAKKTNGSALSSGIVNAFNSIIAAIGQVWQSDTPIVGISSGTAQDQIVAGQAYVPAPGAALLATLGVAAVTLRRRVK
jgi:hypothetical protein